MTWDDVLIESRCLIDAALFSELERWVRMLKNHNVMPPEVVLHLNAVAVEMRWPNGKKVVRLER